jgi:hypothetical protein
MIRIRRAVPLASLIIVLLMNEFLLYAALGLRLKEEAIPQLAD